MIKPGFTISDFHRLRWSEWCQPLELAVFEICPRVKHAWTAAVCSTGPFGTSDCSVAAAVGLGVEVVERLLRLESRQVSIGLDWGLLDSSMVLGVVRALSGVRELVGHLPVSQMLVVAAGAGSCRSEQWLVSGGGWVEAVGGANTGQLWNVRSSKFSIRIKGRVVESVVE